MYEYKLIELMRVVDGDTYDMRISYGFGQSGAFRFRLIGINTAEIYGKNATPEGMAAKEFVEDWFAMRTDQLLRVRTAKTSSATVGIGDGAFGRWACDVVDEAGVSLAVTVREAGFDTSSPPTHHSTTP